nr:hypothetical protein [Oscillospiraceae bacterium]
MKRLMALLLTAALICGLGCPAMAAPGGPGGPPDGPFGGAPGGGPGGGPEMREGDMAATGNSVNTGGLITVVDGRAEANAALSACISQKENDVFVDDLSYCSDHYSTTLISTSGSTVSIRNASVNMTVSEEITGSEQAGTALYTDSGTTVIED